MDLVVGALELCERLLGLVLLAGSDESHRIGTGLIEPRHAKVAGNAFERVRSGERFVEIVLLKSRRDFAEGVVVKKFCKEFCIQAGVAHKALDCLIKVYSGFFQHLYRLFVHKFSRTP